MENIRYTIEPVSSGSGATILLAALVCLAALAALFALMRRPSSGDQRNRQMLGAMLLFFVLLIGSGTAFFSWLNTRKISDIVIYTDAIETPYGKAPFANIRNAYFKTVNQPSIFDPSGASRQTQMLAIEELNGKAHLLSEENYDIKDVFDKLKAAIKQWEKQAEQ
ncbi:MAG: hypothetical protein KDC66_04235 [Phaeodactylibacter sp.]|nr:hypothetical protein [Phaeodactylibacter sp.]MCB9274664.1 hypothetical protein [Lewinellaceae bacterium]